MENFFEKDYLVPSSAADPAGKLSIPGIFDLCMDLASEHAQRLGVGFADMAARRAYWVAVRTRVRLYDRPALMEQVRARTWPGKPGAVKCDRFYRLSRGDTVLAEGRTEWIGQNTDTGRVMKIGDFGYPTELDHLPEKVCQEPFTRFRDQPAEEDRCMTYTVGSRDIDMGRHMNNVAYVRMLLGTFSVAELEAMDIAEAEVSYADACREGETLAVYRWRDGKDWRFLVQKTADESAAVQMVLRLR